MSLVPLYFKNFVLRKICPPPPLNFCGTACSVKPVHIQICTVPLLLYSGPPVLKQGITFHQVNQIHPLNRALMIIFLGDFIFIVSKRHTFCY